MKALFLYGVNCTKYVWDALIPLLPSWDCQIISYPHAMTQKATCLSAGQIICLDTNLKPAGHFFRNLMTKAHMEQYGEQVYAMMAAERPYYTSALMQSLQESFDYTPMLSNIDIPVYLLMGDRGQADAMDYIRDLQLPPMALDRLIIRFIPNSCHMSMIESPEQLAEMLLLMAWLKDTQVQKEMRRMTLKERAGKLKRDVPAVFLVLKDKETPVLVKALAGVTVVYALSPIDLIPDFIPVLGYLDGAIQYVGQFPEQKPLLEQYLSLFEKEQYRTYEVEPELNQILLVHQKYYRDVLYLNIAAEDAEQTMLERLKGLLQVKNPGISMERLEETNVAQAFTKKGYFFQGGQTGGLYGPYIWKTTERQTFTVELPDGMQEYTVQFMDGFISRSWMDYISFGEVGTGGWADETGLISCVKSAYDGTVKPSGCRF